MKFVLSEGCAAIRNPMPAAASATHGIWNQFPGSAKKWLTILLLASCGSATVFAASPTASTAPKPNARASTSSAAMTAELLYLVLLAELQIQAGEQGNGYSLLLESAKKSGDPAIFRRAINVALESRSGDAALDAARAWADNDVRATEPLKLIIQVMLALNRINEAGPTIEQLLKRAPEPEVNELIGALGQTFARAADKSAAAATLEKHLRPWAEKTGHASAAWTALGRTELASGQKTRAEASARAALTATPVAPGAALLAIDLMESGGSALESLVNRYIREHRNDTLVHMAFARLLLRTDRLTEATRELTAITDSNPSAPEPWLMLGALSQQSGKLDEADGQFKRYLSLSSSLSAEQRSRGDTQAYLSLAQVAESQKRFADAKSWLDRIDDSDETLRVELRRASLLAREGKLEEARAWIQGIAENDAADGRTKLIAEVQLLRDANQPEQAYELLERATAKSPEDTDLLYEQAMFAEKTRRFADMEKLLRKVMALKPDHHHAYNALGYSLAERNERLAEAKSLIVKALELAPGDPYITDSLGWVEYRMGNIAEAIRILQSAYDKRPDVEIGAHLSEVLWISGDRQGALKVLREALKLQGDHSALKEVMGRLGISL